MLHGDCPGQTGLNTQDYNGYAIISIVRRTVRGNCYALRRPAVVPVVSRLLEVERIGSRGLHEPGLRVLDPDPAKVYGGKRHQRAAEVDVESTKTVGLAEAIVAEKDRPRCDVFWNNEILHTLRLKRLGLLEAYEPPIAKEYPAAYRDAEGYWHGFAARARVLIVNTKLVSKRDRPTSILDLADPKWHGRTAMAKPLFGTTATHAACLFAVWGDRRAEEFFRKLKHNEVQIVSGNKQVAMAVGGGRADFGLTDTDDALEEVEKGMPVVIVYPDQQRDGLGTLFIPNTLAIIRGACTRRRPIDWSIICCRPRWKRCWP